MLKSRRKTKYLRECIKRKIEGLNSSLAKGLSVSKGSMFFSKSEILRGLNCQWCKYLTKSAHINGFSRVAQLQRDIFTHSTFHCSTNHSWYEFTAC